MKLAKAAVTDESAKKLSIEQRRRIFRDLVTAQDAQVSVAASRQQAMADYGIDEDQVRDIEEEGISKEWPPL